MANLQNVTRILPLPGKKLKKPKPGPSLLHAGFIVLMVGIIAFSIYQVARHMSVGLNTLRTQEIVDRSYVNLELYVFRDEQVLEAAGADACLYRVMDGERVRVGQPLGTAYGVGDAAGAAVLQQNLNAYGTRIALMKDLGGLGTPADARAEADAVDRNYLGLLNATGRGDLAGAWEYGDRMLDGLVRYDILTGAGDGSSVATLESQRDALVAGIPAVAQMTAERAGYFYYTADGYEGIFPYAAAMSMTPAEFKAMTEQTAAAVPTGVVGKMVYRSQWYAAAYVPLSDPAVELFQRGLQAGAAYTMLCGDGAGTSITMTIERLVPDEGGVMLVFSAQDIPEGFDFGRSFRAETVALEVSGYRIPNEALVTLTAKGTGEKVTGVYILTGNVVEFRKIRIQVRRDGYIIAETHEAVEAMLEQLPEDVRGQMTADGWSFLRLNDNIITGNELYEGRVIG